jgi:hypothetical protein
MNALENSLRCLTHPAALLSISLLLLNDHVLKTLAPSWFTGKLSDFAGLFFFPFLLAAILSILADRISLSRRITGGLAFATTAAWFALIKTTPWGNGTTADMLSAFLGFRVQMMLDPTDLVALLVLLPAWRLWNHAPSSKPGRLGWAMLALAALGTVATSAPLPAPLVMRVASVDSILYAELVTNGGTGKSAAVAQSQDGGRTWSDAVLVPSGVFHDNTLPVVFCDPARESLCFRVAQKGIVEQSEDGGQTWRAGWQIPPGRAEYMRRTCGVLGCGKEFDWGPHDLAFFGQGGSSGLVVAMGDEGVLVRAPDGSWQRYAVKRATPSSMAASDLGGALATTLMESAVLFALAVLAVPLLSVGAWLILLLRMGGTPARSRRLWAMRPILIALILLTLAVCVGQAMALVPARYTLPQLTPGAWPSEFERLLDPRAAMGGWTIGGTLLPLISALGVVVGYIWSWRRLASLAARPIRVWLTGCGVIASLLVVPLGWLPLGLWAFGNIAEYSMALLVTVLLVVATLGSSVAGMIAAGVWSTAPRAARI